MDGNRRAKPRYLCTSGGRCAILAGFHNVGDTCFRLKKKGQRRTLHNHNSGREWVYWDCRFHRDRPVSGGQHPNSTRACNGFRIIGIRRSHRASAHDSDWYFYADNYVYKRKPVTLPAGDSANEIRYRTRKQMRRTFAASQERKTPYYITARLVPTRELVPGRLCVTAGSPNLSGNSLINRGSKNVPTRKSRNCQVLSMCAVPVTTLPASAQSPPTLTPRMPTGIGEALCDVKRGSAAHSRRMLFKKERWGGNSDLHLSLEASVFFLR